MPYLTEHDLNFQQPCGIVELIDEQVCYENRVDNYVNGCSQPSCFLLEAAASTFQAYAYGRSHAEAKRRAL